METRFPCRVLVGHLIGEGERTWRPRSRTISEHARASPRSARSSTFPNLIDIQKQSYEKFLQKDVPIEKREDIGLQGVFKSVFPIKDFSETSSIEFVSYTLDKPKYDVDECRQRGMTFAAPIKVTVRLVIWDTNEDTGSQSIRDVKEQEVFFGEIPLMTDNGTFIINGTERVVVSQLHRSPGVFYDHDKGKTHSSGKLLYSARVIPYRGSWLDFEFDPKDLLYVRIDRRRKLHATVLLRALGYSTEDLLNYYYDTETVFLEAGQEVREVGRVRFAAWPARDARRAPPGLARDPGQEEPQVHQAGHQEAEGLERRALPAEVSELVGKVAATDVIDETTGEVVLQCNEELTETKLEELREHGIAQVKILFIDNLNIGSYLRDTLIADKLQTTDEAIMEIYRRLRPGDPPTVETAQNLFEPLLQSRALRPVEGRPPQAELQVQARRGARQHGSHQARHSGNRPLPHRPQERQGPDRRHRSLGQPPRARGRRVDGEPVPHRLVRMERAIKERMSMSQEIETLMPHDLINAKPVSAVVKEYFGSSQLSQFMDQTNPLSEVTHKRRLSALGPGGLDPRARRLRGARRARHALRPHLPD
jgi:DNA-directed RNA polymerase subunit beta